MRRQRTILAAGAAVILMITTPAAYAANVLAVDGIAAPGSVNFTAPSVPGATIGFTTNFGLPASCWASATVGYVERGVTLTAGTRIGAVTSLTLGGCSMTALSYPVVIGKKPGSAEFGVFVTATPSSKTQATVPVEIRSVDLRWRSTGSAPYICDMGLTGTMQGRFNQNTQMLTIAPSSSTNYPLTIVAYNGAGTDTRATPPNDRTCAGQVYTGDLAQVASSLQLATPGVGGIKLQ